MTFTYELCARHERTIYTRSRVSVNEKRFCWFRTVSFRSTEPKMAKSGLDSAEHRENYVHAARTKSRGKNPEERDMRKRSFRADMAEPFFVLRQPRNRARESAELVSSDKEQSNRPTRVFPQRPRRHARKTDRVNTRARSFGPYKTGAKPCVHVDRPSATYDACFILSYVQFLIHWRVRYSPNVVSNSSETSVGLRPMYT